jgi:hypothetical protein
MDGDVETTGQQYPSLQRCFGTNLASSYIHRAVETAGQQHVLLQKWKYQTIEIIFVGKPPVQLSLSRHSIRTVRHVNINPLAWYIPMNCRICGRYSIMPNLMSRCMRSNVAGLSTLHRALETSYAGAQT